MCLEIIVTKLGWFLDAEEVYVDVDTQELMVNFFRCIQPQVDCSPPETDTFVSAVVVYTSMSMVINHMLYYTGMEACGHGRKTAADTTSKEQYVAVQLAIQLDILNNNNSISCTQNEMYMCIILSRMYV